MFKCFVDLKGKFFVNCKSEFLLVFVENNWRFVFCLEVFCKVVYCWFCCFYDVVVFEGLCDVSGVVEFEFGLNFLLLFLLWSSRWRILVIYIICLVWVKICLVIIFLIMCYSVYLKLFF